MNKTGYTNGSSLPIHQDNGSRNRRLPKNIKSIRDMTKHTLTIKPNDIPKWLVDSSYAIQPDIHRHINDNRLSNNIQNIMQTKIKHQELYRGQDGITMGQILWTRHFLAEEGPHVPTTKIYEDNKITILLAENNRTSITKRTRHLNVQYLCVLNQRTNSTLPLRC